MTDLMLIAVIFGNMTFTDTEFELCFPFLFQVLFYVLGLVLFVGVLLLLLLLFSHTHANQEPNFLPVSFHVG